MKRDTEEPSKYRHLEKSSITELLTNINKEDQTVAQTVAQCIPLLSEFIEALVKRMEVGGRLFYIGSGTSGRLGVVDASECPPTFGILQGRVVGIIAGGDAAIRVAKEFAEDDQEQAWRDLKSRDIQPIDTVVGLSASGTTPYVVGGLAKAKQSGVLTACITANSGSPMEAHSDFPIVAKTGPEFVTGSTRMKAGTAQKLILNMISTTAMVQLGHVLDNKMVDMQLSNEKLIQRGMKMIQELLKLPETEARQVLLEKGSVREVLKSKSP